MENDEVAVNYFVLCDQVITEAQTSKQSIIGVYSALIAEQLPLTANLAVAIAVRVHSARRRELTVRFVAPNSEVLFNSPPLPCNWESVDSGLNLSGFATLQIALNLRSMPLPAFGVYHAVLYSDGQVIATFPLSVLRVTQNNAQQAANN